MTLHIRGLPFNVPEPIIGTIATSPNTEGDDCPILLLEDDNIPERIDTRFRAVLTSRKNMIGVPHWVKQSPVIYSLRSKKQLASGDIVLVSPKGIVRILFTPRSRHNFLFVTERCNCNCLMCPQPPKDRDDISYWFEINEKLIQLIPKETESLGVTGGEPTLLGHRLPLLLKSIKENLPSTNILVMTNGRAFAWVNSVKEVAAVNNARTVFAVPLHSDYYLLHDYAVQAKDAHVQTLTGIHNLARFNQRVEIRIVLHKIVIPRLKKLANFIYRNMPFVEHVVFMGLEYMGYTPANGDLLWVEPTGYMAELSDAVQFLSANQMNVSIYNLQLCLLPQHLWKYSKKAISDWKLVYLDECNVCSLISECGGLFVSSAMKHSDYIRPVV
jgi:His-Xaa-Ser system radical SAM maturase HxsC